MANCYWSDLHLAHRNIVKYGQRPFASVEEMNEYLLEEWFQAFQGENGWMTRVFNLGDIAFNLRPFLENQVEAEGDDWLVDRPHMNTLIAGNHDGTRSGSRHAYTSIFGTIIGSERTWEENTLIVDDLIEEQGIRREVKLLLSHAPQKDLQGCDFNLHGHTHNSFLLNPEYRKDPENEWLRFEDPKRPYFNVSVENIGYRPRTFQQLWEMRQLGLNLW